MALQPVRRKPTETDLVELYYQPDGLGVRVFQTAWPPDNEGECYEQIVLELDVDVRALDPQDGAAHKTVAVRLEPDTIRRLVAALLPKVPDRGLFDSRIRHSAARLLLEPMLQSDAVYYGLDGPFDGADEPF